MCSITFIPRANGFLLAMNRDEKWARGALALPPALHHISGVSAVLPTDAEGGTWIALNEHGMSFALLNRNFSGPPYRKTQSRGSVIPYIVAAATTKDAGLRLSEYGVRGTLPFTLLIISAPEERLANVVFDGEELSFTDCAWQRRHWFSSGLSDTLARTHREEAVRTLVGKSGTVTLNEVRALHRSHHAGEAFSMCVHRELVGTVSYTEIDVDRGLGKMNYWPGSPCKTQQPVFIELPIRSVQQMHVQP